MNTLEYRQAYRYYDDNLGETDTTCIFFNDQEIAEEDYLWSQYQVCTKLLSLIGIPFSQEITYWLYDIYSGEWIRPLTEEETNAV